MLMLTLYQTSRYSGVFFQQTNNAESLKTFGLIMAGTIGLISLLNYLSKHTGFSLGSNRGKTANYSKRLFKKEALALGLTKPQIKILDSLIRTYSVNRPMIY
jgi:hypothetical protein